MKKIDPNRLTLIGGLSALAASYVAGLAVVVWGQVTWSGSARTAATVGTLCLLTLGFAAVCRSFWGALEQSGPGLAAVLFGLALLAYAVAVALPPLGVKDNYVNTMMARIAVVHGAPMYAAVPADFPDDPLFPSVPPQWRQDTMLYGPLWAWVSTLPVRLAPADAVQAQLIGMKVLVALAYLLGGLLLWLMVWRRRPDADAGPMPIGQATAAAAPTMSGISSAHHGSSGATGGNGLLAIWLLNPLAYFEIANCAHNDGLMLLALAVFAVGLARRSPAAALPGLAAAVAVKFWPLVLFPALFSLRHSPRKSWLTGIVLAVAVMVLPLLAVAGQDPLAIFHQVLAHQALVQVKYFAPLFFLVWKTAAGLGAGETTAFIVAQAIGAVSVLAAVALAAKGAWLGRLDWRMTSLLVLAVTLAAGLSWLQPWYLLAVLPFLDADNSRAGLALTVGLSLFGFLNYALPWALIVPLIAIPIWLVWYRRRPHVNRSYVK